MNDGSATGVVAITPSNDNDIAKKADSYPRAFYVGVAGDVAFECWDGSRATKAVEAGVIEPFAIRKVLSTGTTATGIVGIY